MPTSSCITTEVLPAPIVPSAPLTTSTSSCAMTRSRSTRSESLSSTRLIDAEFSRRASLLTGASSLAVVMLRESAWGAVPLAPATIVPFASVWASPVTEVHCLEGVLPAVWLASPRKRNV